MNKERELRRFRHDYNAHMTAISGLLANEEYDKLREYIKSMGYFKEKFNLVNSGNIITDAVFNQYKELCDKDNIEFEIFQAETCLKTSIWQKQTCAYCSQI